MKLSRLFTATALTLLVLPAAALAQPQISEGTDETDPFFATVGQTTTQVQVLSDNAVCADNSYDPDTDEELDPNGDDYKMAGIVATLQSQPQSGGPWTDLGSKTISRDDIEVNCDGNEGEAGVEVEVSGQVADVRSNYRIVYRGGGANVNLESRPRLMFPRFPESWKWRNARNIRSTQVTINTDPRLIGIKAVFLLAAGPKYKTFKVTKTATIKKKGSKGYVQIKQSLPASAKKKGWRSYVCLNYQAKYPLMNTGNACPSGTVAASKLEELFPYSSLGPL